MLIQVLGSESRGEVKRRQNRSDIPPSTRTGDFRANGIVLINSAAAACRRHTEKRWILHLRYSSSKSFYENLVWRCHRYELAAWK